MNVRAALLVLPLLLSACVHEDPERRAARIAVSVDEACHLIGEHLTQSAAPGASTPQTRARAEDLKKRMRSKLEDVRLGHTAEHAAIAAYIDDRTRRVSDEELDSGYIDPQGPSRFQAMLAACDALVPDADLAALNARLVEDLKRRYG